MNKVPMHSFPELFSFVKSKTTILAAGKECENLLDLFHLPLSQQAFHQLTILDSDLQQLAVNENSDQWTCIWNSKSFSVAKAYKHLSRHNIIPPSFRWLWHSSIQNKHKVFFWLILKDRLSTRELLKRKNMELQDYNCVLCINPMEESLNHLLLHCPFAISCWNWLQIQVNPDSNVPQAMESFKAQLQVPFFMEIIILMCWTIWKARNGLIF